MSKEPNRNIYVGHRYVPKIMGEWDNKQDYEGLSIVTNQGTSYTSKKRVPVGIDILNEEFWVVTGNYNAQVEYYRQDVRNLDDKITGEMSDLDNKITGEMSDLDNKITGEMSDLDDKITGEMSDLDDKITGEMSDLDDKITGEMSDLDENIDKMYSKNNTNRIPVSSINSEKRKKPLISFVDDDGNAAVRTKLKPIAEEHNIPFNLALIGSLLEQGSNSVITTDEALDFQNNLGWEILSHGYDHIEHLDPGISYEEIEHDLRYSVEYLRSKGLDVKSFVYPGGQYDDESIRLTSKYYNSGLSTGAYINTLPLIDYKLGRFSYPERSPNNTFEYYKSKVDEAVENNGWLIWMTHCGQPDFDENQTQILRQLIAYIKSIDVDIVTIQQGLDEVGNVLSVNNNELYIASDGSNNVANHLYPKEDNITGIETVTTDTKPNELVSGKTYVSSIYTANNISKTPSGIRGLLTIYRANASFHSYRRYVDSEKNEYISYSNTAGDDWTPFVKILNTSGEQSHVLESATISGNGYYSFNMIPDPRQYSDKLHAMVKPKNELPQGLIFSSYHTGTGGSVNVRLYNTTESDITLTDFEWIFIITSL